MDDQHPSWDEFQEHAEKVIDLHKYRAEWDPNRMREAMRNICDGWGYRVAADNTGINKATIHKNFNRALDRWEADQPDEEEHTWLPS